MKYFSRWMLVALAAGLTGCVDDGMYSGYYTNAHPRHYHTEVTSGYNGTYRTNASQLPGHHKRSTQSAYYSSQTSSSAEPTPAANGGYSTSHQ